MNEISITDAELYLEKNEERLLAGGISGAKVYDIAGKYVFKRVRRAELKDDELYMAYRREAFWYESMTGKGADQKAPQSFLPEILDLSHNDEEIKILMKHYRTIPREKIGEGLLKKIMEALAAVHTADIPAFLRQKQEGGEDCEKQDRQTQKDKGQEQDARTQKDKGQEQDAAQKAQLLSDGEICASLAGWRSVLAEHPGIFDEMPLADLAEKINDIIRWHANENAVLNHGDFHWNNLLQDAQGKIRICDWQGVSVGAASGDLSFFFSRLGADGICLDEKQVIGFYTQEIRRISGKLLHPEEICKHMDAADVITSFRFWHEYLHGNDVGRVQGIYGKMVDKAKNFA